MNKRGIYRTIKFVLFLCVLLCGYIFLRVTRCSEYLDPERLMDFLSSWEERSPIIFIAISSIRPVFLFPTSILIIASGILYGKILGTLYGVAGSTLGAVVAYFFSRMLGSDFVQLIFGARLHQMESILSAQGLRIIFILRLIPVVPFDLVNYASGLVRVNFLQYVGGTFLGLIPATFAYTFLGESLKKLYSFQFFLSIFFFIVLIYLPLLYEQRRRKEGKPSLIDISGKKEKDD